MSRVNHPKHYNSHPSGIECIRVIRCMNLPLGNAVKYLWRAGLKDDAPTVEDFRKAVWYIEDEYANGRGVSNMVAPADIHWQTIKRHMPENVGMAFLYIWRFSFDEAGRETLRTAANHIRQEIRRVDADRIAELQRGLKNARREGDRDDIADFEAELAEYDL